jgi:hypothetical protein
VSEFDEPWTSENGVIETGDGKRIPDYCDDATDEPTAKRIVACVNACRDLPDEMLERVNQLGGFWDKERNCFNPHLP